MKRSLLTMLIVLLFSAISFAQPLTGTKNIPADYASFSLAISALNTNGVGTGGVTFTVNAGYTETAANLLITATGTSANPIVFQRTGSGANPLITAGTGVSTTLDGIIVLRGTDYITFDGIDLAENAANTTPTTRMEFGYALLKTSATDGCQYVTIKNCTINLNKTYISSVGIYSNNHTPASITALTLTAASGTNSYNKFYGNTIGNCFQGIYLQGSSTATWYDVSNEIGKDKDIANNITNVGGGTASLVAPYNNASASGIYTVYQNNLKVTNNNVTSTMAGSKSVYGIFLTTATNANLDFFGNSVTLNFSPTDGINAAFNGIYCDMGASGTTNTVNIYNNAVTNCTYPTLAGAGVYGMYLLNLGVNGNVYNNIVSNNTFGSGSVTGTGQIAYMRLTKTSTTAGPLVVRDNAVNGNTRLQSVVGNAATYFLWIAGSGTTHNCYNNTINNNIVGANGAANGIYMGFNESVSKSVYNNTISNITQANGSVNGIYVYQGKLSYFFKNTIRNISASSTAAGAAINGIYISNTAPTTGYYYNNMISQLSCPASISTLGYDYNTLNGIYVDASASFKGIYYNTVYLNATTTVSGANDFGSSAFCAFSLAGVDLRNNILVNASACAGTNGKSVAIRARGTSFTNFTSNYNNLYAGTPAFEHLLFWNGTAGAQTLVAYRTLVTPNELQSVSELPPFVNVSTSPYDLHLQSGVPTQCEAGGIEMTSPLAINVDFDSIARFPNAGYPAGSSTPNAPDLGADEFGGSSNDVTAPSIVYTPLAFTSSLTARTLTATITDGSGVPTSLSGLPVIYWKINSGPWQASQATWISGNNYSFSFGGGVNYHDIVYYFVAAQDMATSINVGTMPWQGAAGFTANPPGCGTPPTTLNSYNVLLAISGVKHVGVGKDFETLTAAAAALNDRFMSATVTFVLDDNNYPSETYPILFNTNPGNTATSRLVIKPNTGATPLLSGSVPGSCLIKMNGIDFVTIDGSNAGLKDQSLTIENMSGINNSYTFGITNNGGTDPSTNVTMKNCVVRGNNANCQMETYDIVFGEGGGLTSGGYDSCKFDNNSIKRSKYGIYMTGVSSNISHNLVISNNTIGAADGPNYIRRFGVAVEQTDNALITGNDIMGNAVGDTCAVVFGIYYGNNCSNTKITKNKIHDWVSISLGASGIKCSNDNNATVTEISNNQIYNIGCAGMNPGPSNNNAYGIFMRQGGNTRIWYNTIYLSGPYLYGIDNYAPSSACLCFYDAASNINIDCRNNILRNSMTNPAPVPGPDAVGKAYGIQMSGVASMFVASSLDYNDYYIDGYQGQIAQQWATGLGPVADYPTLASWQTFTAQESHSITNNPVFVSDVNPIDLHPTSTYLNCAAKTITGQPISDFANVTRKNPPDPGAYEFQYTITDYHTLAATAITQTTATLKGDINTNGEVVEIYLTYDLTTAYGNYGNPTGLGSPPKIRSFTLTTLNAPITGLTPNTTYHYRLDGFPGTNGQAEILGSDMTFTTLPLAPAVVTTAATSLTYSGATLNGTVNANSGVSSVSFNYGLTVSYGTTVTANPATVTGSSATSVSAPLTGLLPNTLYHYRVTATNAGGTTNGSDLTFTTPDNLKTFNLTVFLEGLYAGSSTMNQANDANGVHFGAGIADKINVEFHDGANYASVVYSASNVDLHTNGTATVTVPALYSGSYYVTIKHRNSIQTVSAAPVSFPSGTINYNFSDNANKAYGSNLLMMTDGKYVIYGGDVNQDDIVDGGDMAPVDNQSALFASGYIPEDLNGDGLVDGTDMSIADNNSALFLTAQLP